MTHGQSNSGQPHSTQNRNIEQENKNRVTGSHSHKEYVGCLDCLRHIRNHRPRNRGSDYDYEITDFVRKRMEEYITIQRRDKTDTTLKTG